MFLFPAGAFSFPRAMSQADASTSISSYMQKYNSNIRIIIGVDHGYGNMKTAHKVFRTGVECMDEEPIVFGTQNAIPVLLSDSV